MHHIDSAYILAGGRSSRFGKNKALVEIDGVPLLVRLTQQLQASGLEVKLVAQSDLDYAEFGVTTIADGIENAGPLAGLRAVFRDSLKSGIAWSLIIGCDLIEWRPEWLEQLQQARDFGENGQSTQIVVFEGEPFRPFPGLYRSDLFELVDRIMNTGVQSVRGLFGGLAGNVRSCPLPTNPPRSFNTVEEFERLKEELT